MKKFLSILSLLVFAIASTYAAPKFISFEGGSDSWCLTESRGEVTCDPADWKGVLIAVENLKKDLVKVTGRNNYNIVVGTLGKSKVVEKAIKKCPSVKKELQGKNEKFIITVSDGTLVIAGSDKRGTIYGVYELSEQIGVSPWYDWADVPVAKHNKIYVSKGTYTDGEPAVKYRGIFLNDEAPALSGWVGQNYGGVYNHEFYARVFELVLRLKGNFMWPAMWNSSFYADDPLNMQTADDMGVMMGTSHHEPMAKAHKEWTRDKSHGAWNYDENKAQLDDFWKSGVERMKNTEDVVTIGMRGNGDEPMGKNADVALLEKIVSNQRRLIEEATGKPAKETPQVWALYKEVQEYYEKGMTVPDDVILLLCDDNWGNVRILPELGAKVAKKGSVKPANVWESRHPGGYGMYYHVDYVGGPRNSKFINVSQIQRIWEQMQLTYEYGVDKLWILNVGDLKPMEFPIDFWFRMAWNPSQFNASNLQEYTESFCRQQFGEEYAEESARILNLHGKYVHRRTPEQLDAFTYSLKNGEWSTRVAEYHMLEKDAEMLYSKLPAETKDAYDQLVRFPIQAMTNLYDMYYALAQGDSVGVARYFKQDSVLCAHYNHEISNGKWNHFADEIHIGYRSWNSPPRNIMPTLGGGNNRWMRGQNAPQRPQNAGNADAKSVNSEIVIDADKHMKKTDAANAKWQVIPDFGIYKSAIALFPYTSLTDGASVEYEFTLSSTDAEVNICFAPTFPFNGGKGQRVKVAIDGGEPQIININEASKYIRDGYRDQNYEWEKTRINKQKMNFKLGNTNENKHVISVSPLDPGVVIERIIIL